MTTWAVGLLWTWAGLHIVLMAIMLAGASRFQRQPPSLSKASLPTLMIPVFNEARHQRQVAANLDAAGSAGMAALLVDDGSTDGSAPVLATLARETGADLIRQAANLGKAVALQTGFRHIESPVVLTLDADTTADFAMLASTVGVPDDTNVGAVALRVDVAETGRLLERAQAAEYDYVLNFERAALCGYGVVLTVPGAAALWRREAVLAVGGFTPRTLAEDTDVTLRLQMYGWRIVVTAEVRALTLCPSTFAGLGRQRARWIWGNLQAAAFAGITAMRDERVKSSRAACVMLALSAVSVFGHLVLTLTAIRLVLFDLRSADLWASATLLLATMARIVFVRRIFGTDSRSIAAAIGGLLVMQAMNLCGFWLGLLKGYPFRQRW